MRMSLILLKSVEILRSFIIIENNVKPGESGKFSQGYNNNMLENLDSHSVLGFLKAERTNTAWYRK